LPETIRRCLLTNTAELIAAGPRIGRDLHAAVVSAVDCCAAGQPALVDGTYR
jgi:hypothetical protein